MMSLIEKAYFTLEEVEERWQIPRRDMVYLAENGMLRLSVRLFGVRLESGQCEEADGQWFSIPFEQTWFDGLQDLTKQDAFRLFRDGSVAVRRFAAPEGEYRCLLAGEEPLLLNQTDIVIRREERDRVEHQHGLATVKRQSSESPADTPESTKLPRDGAAFHLGPIQARIVRHLHEAALAGTPWCYGKAVLRAVGSSSRRLADVFKSQPRWRQIIESDGRGNYRLRSP